MVERNNRMKKSTVCFPTMFLQRFLKRQQEVCKDDEGTI